jgi:hypothetical protein
MQNKTILPKKQLVYKRVTIDPCKCRIAELLTSGIVQAQQLPILFSRNADTGTL